MIFGFVFMLKNMKNITDMEMVNLFHTKKPAKLVLNIVLKI